MYRIGVPELLIFFTIVLLVFVPRAVPSMRNAAEQKGYSLPLVAAFGLFLLIAFVYGIVNTLELFR